MSFRTTGFFFAFLLLVSFQSFALDSCAKACVIHAECGTGGICDRGSCKYKNFYCGNERWSANDRGETANCDAYKCSESSGVCLRRAERETDCTKGYVFDGTHRCVPSIQCDSTTTHCQDLIVRWKRARTSYEALTLEPHPAPLTCVACESDLTCASQEMCWGGRCVERRAYCIEDSSGEEFKVNTLGQASSCGQYACEKVRGECFSSCQKPSDCRKGSVCLRGQCRS
jgi:hypothetical protein